MKLCIDKIADRGVPNYERLHITVLEPTNLGSHFVILSAYLSPKTVANGHKSCFWFPPQDVKQHDEIVLYTRAGNYEPPSVGLIWSTYTYFWGHGQTIWNDLATCALLFDVSSWQASINEFLAKQLTQITSGPQTAGALNTLGQLAQTQQGNSLAGLMQRFEADQRNPILRPVDDDEQGDHFVP